MTHWFLLLASFRFCETQYLHFTTRAFGHSAIAPFLGGVSLLCYVRYHTPMSCLLIWRCRVKSPTPHIASYDASHMSSVSRGASYHASRYRKTCLSSQHMSLLTRGDMSPRMRRLFDRKNPPPPGGFPIYYVPSSRTVCKRTPLEEPGTNPSRGVLLHTVLDEGT